MEGSNVLGMTDIYWLQLSLICFVWREGRAKIDDWANVFFFFFLEKKILLVYKEAMYDKQFLLNLDL